MGANYNSRWTIVEALRQFPSYTPRLLIQAEAGSFEATNQYHRQYIAINGTAVVNADSPRSYRLTQLRNNGSDWSLVASNGYDVYGSTVAADSARTFLQSFLAYDMLILNTWDEPYNNAVSYLYPTLTGDFGSKIDTYTRSFRDMHLLIAVKGKGIIYEGYRPRYYDSIHFSGWI